MRSILFLDFVCVDEIVGLGDLKNEVLSRRWSSEMASIGLYFIEKARRSRHGLLVPSSATEYGWTHSLLCFLSTGDIWRGRMAFSRLRKGTSGASWPWGRPGAAFASGERRCLLCVC